MRSITAGQLITLLACSREFDMLELNATFYGWFKEETFDSWRDR